MKKIIVVVLIAVLAATTVLLYVSQLETKAYTIRVDYSDTVGYPGPDYFCECCHTDLNQLDDCMVGLSITGTYDTAYPYGPCYYEWGSWTFNQEVSANYNWSNQTSWWFYPSPSSSHDCTYDIMYTGTSYYTGTSFYDNSIPAYNNENGAVTLTYTYPNNGQAMQFSPDATSLNGQSYGAFYLYSNPNQIRYMSAGPTGSYYYIESAHAGPPVPTATTFYTSG